MALISSLRIHHPAASKQGQASSCSSGAAATLQYFGACSALAPAKDAWRAVRRGWQRLPAGPNLVALLLPVPRPQLVADMRDALPAERVASLVEHLRVE